jgi:hypothetical protein
MTAMTKTELIMRSHTPIHGGFTLGIISRSSMPKKLRRVLNLLDAVDNNHIAGFGMRYVGPGGVTVYEVYDKYTLAQPSVRRYLHLNVFTQGTCDGQ